MSLNLKFALFKDEGPLRLLSKNGKRTLFFCKKDILIKIKRISLVINQ